MILISGTLPFIVPTLISQLVKKIGAVGKNQLECPVVEEWECFKWFTDGGHYGKGRLTKEKVNTVLRKHACGRNEGVKKESTNFLLKKHIPIQYYSIQW